MTSKVIRTEQCPRCADEGKDISQNNLAVYDDGHKYCYAGHGLLYTEGFQDLTFTFEYLPWRGVSKDTMKFYDIKTKISAEGEPICIGYQYPSQGYKVRSLKDKEFWITGELKGLFGRDKFNAGSHKYVTITEGELDAASLYQVLRSPVVSVQSASVASRDCANDRSWLNSFERIYLAFDGDEAGREAVRSVARLFEYDKVYHVRFDGKYKDANEFLQGGDEEVLRQVWWNSKHYLPENIKSSLDEFDQILSKKKPAGIPYPFPKLTEMTYGMRTGETVLITAQEGVGKTEIVHAIEYQLLTRTEDNVGCLFLEEPDDRHLQALAGIHLKRPTHLPDCGCSDSEIRSAVRSVVGRDDRLHLYSWFGANDTDLLTDHIRFLVTARNCRWVLLDHISMAVSGDSEADERRRIDKFCTDVQMMVKRLDFGLVMVCHVNDMNQTRSSRWPSKIADVRIHATRDLDSGSNIVDLTIKDKNRLVGKTGFAGSYAFDMNTRQYTPIANDNGATDVSLRQKTA